MASAGKLEAALGVTRVARVTGLDRTQVEVACAIRPLGHVLQVSQGKGRSWQAARLSALAEACELYAAEQNPPPLTFARSGQLPGEVWGPNETGGASAKELSGSNVAQAWLWAPKLSGAGGVWVPASALYCPPSDVPWPGPLTTRWTSNGMGAARGKPSALRHALLEALEREALCRVLPAGWVEETCAKRKLECHLPLGAQLSARGFEVGLFDLTPRHWPLPVIGALLLDRERGPVPLTAGYACRLEARSAAESALLEAAQSRLTEIHAAREDVVLADRSSGVELAAALMRARSRRKLERLPRARAVQLPQGASAAVWWYPNTPLHVAKVLVRGFGVSELLQ